MIVNSGKQETKPYIEDLNKSQTVVSKLCGIEMCNRQTDKWTEINQYTPFLLRGAITIKEIGNLHFMFIYFLKLPVHI